MCRVNTLVFKSQGDIHIPLNDTRTLFDTIHKT